MLPFTETTKPDLEQLSQKCTELYEKDNYRTKYDWIEGSITNVNRKTKFSTFNLDKILGLNDFKRKQHIVLEKNL